jgi:hypothetical protein
MIARTWHGRVPASKADDYHAYLERTGFADYQATPGYVGIVAERWIEGDVAHFQLTTLWESEAAIRSFAGDDISVARYYQEDDAFLLEREPTVRHAEVLVAKL